MTLKRKPIYGLLHHAKKNPRRVSPGASSLDGEEGGEVGGTNLLTS